MKQEEIFMKTCKKCGYIWQSKKINPKCCPLCKTYYWKGDKDVG